LVHELVQQVHSERDARLVAENDAAYAKQQVLQAQFAIGEYRTLADRGEPR
jgi:hypothetical protein